MTTEHATTALRRALAPFGLAPFGLAPDDARSVSAPIDVPSSMPDAGITLVTGPSGSGKSRLLANLSKQSRVVVGSTERIEPNTSVIDQFEGDASARDIERRLRLLAGFGLADATLFARRAGILSEGERHRLALAVAADRAERTDARLVLFDEFCSPLDRVTAASVAAGLWKWSRGAGRAVVCATAHEDMAALLAPDTLLRLDGRTARFHERTQTRPRMLRRRFAIEPGTIADYDRLARHHYRAGRPAVWSRVLRATNAGQIVGVLVTARPTLNGAWRRRAWPGRYRTDRRSAAARRLNREVRRIARVVVDPRYRGVGLARRLVESYLAEPETPATEAVAVIGGLCPFFERAGMEPFRIRARAEDLRLADALDEAGLSWWDLTGDAARPAWLRAELERWARSIGRAGMRLCSQREIERAAARRLGSVTAPGMGEAIGGMGRAYAHAG